MDTKSVKMEPPISKDISNLPMRDLWPALRRPLPMVESISNPGKVPRSRPLPILKRTETMLRLEHYPTLPVSKEPEMVCNHWYQSISCTNVLHTDIAALVAALKSGSSVKDCLEQFPATTFRYIKQVQQLKLFLSSPRRTKSKVYWFYGPTGSGKSREAARRFPQAYWQAGKEWFDGYDGTSDVVFDDLRPTSIAFQLFLRMLDWTQMMVEFKGGYINFAPKRICVTTLHDPFTFTPVGEAAEQLERRIKVCIRFSNFDLPERIDLKTYRTNINIKDAVPAPAAPVVMNTGAGVVHLDLEKDDDDDN